MNTRLQRTTILATATLAVLLGLHAGSGMGELNIAQGPLYLGGSAAPLNMMVLGRDHTLYYEAYNDASDLNGDGVLDVGYKPETVDYFGYFDSFKCYRYDRDAGRFDPVASAAGKKCGQVQNGGWSGDFLNYVTTARIDALRKVLYGGRRIVDDGGLVVLERSYIPQDAHSWGKEYRGILQDGYDIREYTELPLPTAGTRHLFANTTLLKSGNKEPLLRVLVHSRYRIWEWVAIERPVADAQCEDTAGRRACEATGAAAACTIVPAMSLTQTTWKVTNTAFGGDGKFPSNKAQFDSLEGLNANHANKCGEQPVTEVNGSGNPFKQKSGCTDDRYLNIFHGTIEIVDAGRYTFAVDGDDAVEFSINNQVVAHWYGGHAQCSSDSCRCNDHTGSVYLSAGTHYVRFRHQEHTGGDQYYLRWRLSTPDSTITDYIVRNRVCDPAVGLEANCRVYPAGDYKPAGLLQRHGEDDRMYFGLISGSYTHPYNMRGGVLRKNMGSIRDEIDLHTGEYSDVNGIISTIDKMRIVDFDKGRNYEYNGRWLVNASMSASDRKYPDWGNPIGEMLYEAIRYFAGKSGPTTEFRPTTNSAETVTLRDFAGTASTMALPLPEWEDPFDEGFESPSWCSAGAMLVISDVNPSYDTEYVPGSSFSTFGGDMSGINATALANAIWLAEHGGVTRSHFIGQVGSDYDGAPTAKGVSGLGNIRGLAPAEPTKQGGYYAASMAKYAFETDLRGDVAGTQNLNTVVVALASPLPKIEIPVVGTTINIVPFAKSVGGSVDSQTISAAKRNFQPTDTIVDFFVDNFANTDPNGSDADQNVNEGRPLVRFRINFEDVEQGADHDMDAIVLYEARVNADNSVTVNLSSDYAAGSIIQHMGYVISGTTEDGVYLEVRDEDTSASNDPAYFLDTPPGLPPGACDAINRPGACNEALPLQASRTFLPGSAGATLLESPLWYAAKYGTKPKDGAAEGDTSTNYFLVTNASNLEKQLERAFYEILGLVSSASAAATNSTLLRDDTLVYQARFDSGDWSGEVRAVEINSDGSQGGTRWSTNDADAIPTPALRRVWTYNSVEGLAFDRDQLDDFSVAQCAGLLGHGVGDLAAALVDCDADAAPGATDWCTCGDLNPTLVPGLDPPIDRNLVGDRIDWLRGDTTKVAERNFRVRSRPLGDIVNSNPFLVDIKDYAFQSLAASGPETDYDAFLAALREADRPPVLYVGGNDGMLHALHGNTGEELFAYVPHGVYTHIAELIKPSYQHRYFVDGSPWAVDAYIETAIGEFAWRTVLVGSTGAGGRTVFALDVTEPDAFDGEDVLWEFAHPELGVPIGRPTIARVNAGWVAIFGNGYNSQSAKAQLFIVDLASGDLIRRIDTGVGDGLTPNGLASPTPVDLDSDRIAESVYAGDLHGNLWRFDLSALNPAEWAIAFEGNPLFVATDASLVPQPITSRPAVARHPFGGAMVMFGTGKFFSDDDNIVPMDVQVQSFYGIHDDDVPVGARAERLQEQTIIYQGRSGNRAIRDELRVISNHPVDYARQSGWYIDLSYQGARKGERVVDHSIMRTDRVVFVSLIPNDDQCSAGGTSWLMELDYLQGGRLPYSVFDMNDDDAFGIADFIRVTVPVAGGEEGNDTEVLMLPASSIYIPAIAKIPAFVSAKTKDVKYSSLSSGSLLDVDNAPGPAGGRQSWRQLR